MYLILWCVYTYNLLQEVLLWIKSVIEETGSDVTTDQLKDYVWKTLKSGKVAYLSVILIEKVFTLCSNTGWLNVMRFEMLCHRSNRADLDCLCKCYVNCCLLSCRNQIPNSLVTLCCRLFLALVMVFCVRQTRGIHVKGSSPWSICLRIHFSSWSVWTLYLIAFTFLGSKI